jgi:hypothetical protein
MNWEFIEFQTLIEKNVCKWKYILLEQKIIIFYLLNELFSLYILIHKYIFLLYNKSNYLNFCDFL